MDLTFRIIWFEDVDEWFNTLSRRVTRYIKKKNLNVKIERIGDISDFSVQKYDFSKYDLLIVDYELDTISKDGEKAIIYGSEIINTIRQGQFVNDVLFYSSHGYKTISDILKKEGLQGVFLADRGNDEFVQMVQKLIDKAVRRTENIINIRGIVMDATSDFDNKIRDIISISWKHLGNETDRISKDINKKLLLSNQKSAEKLLQKYSKVDASNIDELLNERDFSAIRQARLLNWCINANEDLKMLIEPIYIKYIKNSPVEENIPFFETYKKDIIDYRNALAHVKNAPEVDGEFYIGEIDGENVKFDASLCNILRGRLITYSSLLDEIYQTLEESY
ncbi:MAG: hypothetical protein IJE49_05585 [Agathobacter sp.]|nr:hypothetical protein [Agathobacter sp.]